jgi:hypothetical protein
MRAANLSACRFGGGASLSCERRSRAKAFEVNFFGDTIRLFDAKARPCVSYTTVTFIGAEPSEPRAV